MYLAIYSACTRLQFEVDFEDLDLDVAFDIFCLREYMNFIIICLSLAKLFFEHKFSGKLYIIVIRGLSSS